MWAAVVFPPLVVPWEFQRPTGCPSCGASRPLYVHQRVLRKIAHLGSTGRTEAVRQQAASGLSHYCGTRLRCPACQKTFTFDPTPVHQQSRTPPYVAAKVAVAYCIGMPVSQILASIASEDITLSRASLYRVLATQPVPGLQFLHRRNVARRRRLLRTAPQSEWLSVPDSIRAAAWSERVLDSSPEPLPVKAHQRDRFAICRASGTVFFVYGDALGRVTLDWIEALMGFYQGAVFRRFRTIDQVIDRFRVYDVLNGDYQDAYAAAFIQASRQCTLDEQSPLVRHIIASCVRVVHTDINLRDHANMVFQGDDIYDDVQRTSPK